MLGKVFRSFKKVFRSLLLSGRYAYRFFYLTKINFKASFPYELSGGIKVPRQLCSLGDKEFRFSFRSGNEVLLRTVAAKLLKSHSDENFQAVIDIGAWIGDNTIVWSKMVQPFGYCKIISIDPSSKNISYFKKLASLNDCINIGFHTSLCSSRTGMSFDIEGGSLEHGRFKESMSTDSLLPKSTTLDEIYSSYGGNYNLLLMHLDVEGQEYNVLEGSRGIIDKCKPYVLFECHIKRESGMLNKILSFLKARGYSTWMINEILPGCQLDCRNFLSIHNSRVFMVDNLQSSYEDARLHKSFFPAVSDGVALLKVD